MGKPGSQQRDLAGEYYIAFILSRLGYDIGVTIGGAKIFDMIALAPSGKVINMRSIAVIICGGGRLKV